MKLKKFICFFAMLLCLTSIAALSVKSQTEQEVIEDTKKLIALYKQQNFNEALPYAEKLIKIVPDSAELQFIYGFCLLGKSKNTPDKEAAKQLVIKARQAFLKSKELGNNNELLNALLALPADGNTGSKFSKNEAAEKAMNDAEAFFTQGKMDQALVEYKKALDLDPTIYEAALFSGDAYSQKEDFANAEIWYQKAIAINPNRETAYRYSATPLMKQKKYDAARDRYIEAFIVEPYSRFATLGISQWGQKTQTNLGHPKVDVPEIKYDENGKSNSTVNINPLANDNSFAWIAYPATREIWRKEKFAKAFPNEKQYRHTLQEEAEALRSVIKLAKEKKAEKANPQIEILTKLDAEGLLEPFILLALPDNGIAQDHSAYLKSNRENLRKYVLNYVVNSK